MRFYADAVEDQNVKVAEAVHRGGRDDLEIGGVGKIVKSVGDHGKFAVRHLERGYFQIVADAECGSRLDRVRYELRQAAAEMSWIEDVLEYATKVGPSNLVRINAHRAVAKIQLTNIVKPKNVVNVTMRDENCVKMADLCS